MPLKPEEASQEEWDAAARLRDAVNIHWDALREEACGKYVAVKLADGSSDGTLYDTRRAATRHQSDPWCFYVRVSAGGIQLKEAWVVLCYARQAKKAGIVFSEEEVVLPQRMELAGPWLARQRRALAPHQMPFRGGTFHG